MNLQSTLLPNNFFSFNKRFPSSFPQHHQSPSILPKLRQALAQSLARFTLYELQKRAQVQSRSDTQKKAPQIIENIIQILSSDEEISNQNIKLIDANKQHQTKNQIPIKQVEEKTDSSKDHLDFEKDSSLKSQHQTSNHVQKMHKIKKEKPTKTHLKLRKHKFSQIQENLDLTQTAEIMLRPISAYERNQKMEGLLQRRVLNWDDVLSLKKERREIRMLQN